MSSPKLRPVHVRDADTISIESSNVTGSDLPGAGRTLGNVYSILGRRLESALNRSRAQNTHPSTPNVGTSGLDPHSGHPGNVAVVSVESSNVTESDLPGLGRTLGNVYNRLGKQLESAFNQFANWKGLGPGAIALRVEKRSQKILLRQLESKASYTAREGANQRKDLRKLVRYTKYGPAITPFTFSVTSLL